MGYLVYAYYNISPTRYYKDDSCWSADLKSKTIEDIIIIGSFIKVLVLILYVLVKKILTDNGIEFVNQTLRDYYEEVGISHQTSVSRTPQQNGIVERRNRTLVEAA
ncbi:retrovirus-related pol polyprotein from transposon TNT 1-94 [Tanacetum coccineum]|uniref:Retrovirus-related pol polyprotein from transposon TNT 1-94 n=1 Tax=Tanacetum coccineum TaxID=301880 RepID=A0ABQ5GFT8_9ASTR